MNVVDSFGWLKYFADGPNANTFAKSIESSGSLIVPSLSLYEVFERIVQQRGEDLALQAIAVMKQGRIVDLDRSLALAAAQLSIELKLPLADSVMLATARGTGAVLWTQDADFELIPGVRYFRKH